MKKLIRIAFLLVVASIVVHAQQTVGLFSYDPVKSFNGLTLFSSMASKTTHLIDNCGREVHSWQSNAGAAFSVYLLPDGSLLRPEASMRTSHFNLGLSGGHIERMAWDGTVLWSFDIGSDTDCPHHDICPLPNGNILVLMWEVRSPEQVIAAGRPDSSAGECWSEKIVELKPVGTNDAEIVWEWHLWDHLIQDLDPAKAHYGSVSENPQRFSVNAIVPPKTFADWVHANGLHYDAERDEIVISCRIPSEFWVIDHSTTMSEAAGSTGGRSGKGGDFLYRWGNPQMYKQGSAENATLGHQHNVQFIRSGPNKTLGFIVFNNDAGSTSDPYSSVDFIYPPMNSDGSYALLDNKFGPEKADRRYTATPRESLYSAIISGAEILPNGNLLICAGTSGTFTEVDSTNTVVWKYVNPDCQGVFASQGQTPNFNSVFRCTRYPYNYPAFADKSLNASLPLELNPIPDNCVLAAAVNDILQSSTPTEELMGEELCTGMLHYSISASENVRVSLYDANARFVRDLHDGWKNSGTYTVDLRAMVGPGLYFIRTESAHGAGLRKVMIH